jgi:hypothetical protein
MTPMIHRDHAGGRPPWFRYRASLRLVAIVLGAIWVVDGLLQLQPSMFRRSFATDTLGGTSQGQPWWVFHSVTHVAHDLAPHIAEWNVLFAVTQLAIGACLLANRAVKPALAASIGWSVLVWWLGEAFGGIFGGSASLVTGAPGAVLVYGLLALLVWPREHGVAGTQVGPEAAESIVGAWGGRAMWSVLWVGSAVLQLLPANRSNGSINSAISGAGSGEPHVLASLSNGAAHLIGTHGIGAAVILAVVEAAIGVGVLWRKPNVVLAAGIALSLVFWVVGQDLGGILTGSGTDPNTGPLFVLLALTLWQGVPRLATAPARRTGCSTRPAATCDTRPGAPAGA